MSEEEDEHEHQIIETTIAVAAISYYLYRLAGCPFGDTPSGLNAWNSVQIKEFVKLTKRFNS